MLQSLPVADGVLLRLLLAAALGLLMGLEREWSHHSAGIRTFSLLALLGALFTVVGPVALVAVGAGFTALLALLLVVRGVFDEQEGLSLTTAVSMLVAYGVGTLVGSGLLIEGVTVAVLSSLLLVLKRELHDFAWGLTHRELRASVEFGVLAFVVYPLLPSDAVTVTVGGLAVSVEPRVVWLLVVTVAAIGIVNYAIVRTYGGRGIAVTGFFAGLASSTAVVGTMLDHVRQYPAATSYAVAAVLLADAAMAVRNLAIVLAFTGGDAAMVWLLVPLGAVVVVALVVAATTADWRHSVEVDLESPFSLRNALAFGLLFAVVLVGSGLAKAAFGDTGLLAASAVSGLVSSAGATTSAVVLYRGGAISAETTLLAVTLASLASIAVKAGLTLTSSSRTFGTRVAVFSGGLVVVAGVASLLLVLV